ncbi:nucleolar protein 14 homolog [Ischnura elegans]|uniref:nucleolar protein 14 homolog n=1 Tax=Ischnura elegans TaxID=197161 RepID=UPI001ED89C80|nr:nucleolar protein 14 homolog [Ischnura elegans]
MGKVKNKLKKNLSDRSKEKPKKSTNPFEVHLNRQKFSVIGRNLKHDKGLPGISRSKAFSKRKATLLREYQLKNKSNKFMDRRIGEKSRFMTPEDRVTARFTAERIKAHKKSIYNLADEEVLTHRGHALSEIEKFDDPKSDDDDDDRGKLEGKFVKEAHFGGFLTKKEETESQAKSRKELIDQLIAESKKRRYEKQKLQDETLELTDKLDTQWKDLLPLVSLGSSEPPVDEKKPEVPHPDPPKERPKVDPYDLAVQELKFEARGKPSEKLKTEEEIAKEEKEKLEKLELERQRRMHGFVNDNANSIKHRSADDLDDGFALESDIEDPVEDGQSKVSKDSDDAVSDGEGEAGNDGGSNDNDEDGDASAGEAEEEDDDDNDEDESSDEEFSDLVLESSDGENNQEEDADSKHSEGKNEDSSTTVKKGGKEEKKLNVDHAVEPEGVTNKKTSNDDVSKNGDDLSEVTNRVREELLKRKAMMEKARKELPYTYSVPNVYDDFYVLMKDLSPEQQSVVLERMIKCTHPSLKSGNRQLLEALFVYTLQFIYDCPQAFQPSSSEEFNSEAKYCFAVLRNIISHIYDLAQTSPDNAASSVAEVIKEKFEEVGKEYPGLDLLLFLKMIPEIFPTSDFRHCVCTPSIVLMTHILRSCRVKSRRDIAAGLFLTSLLHEYSSLSKRFSPEAVSFLLNVIYMAIPKAPGLPEPPIPPMYKNISDDSTNLLVIIKNPFANMEPPDLILEAEDLDESNEKIDGSFRARALNVAVQLILSWINQLNDLPAKKDIFQPSMGLISLLPTSAYPESLANSVKVLEETLMDMVNNCGPIERLARAAKKPKPLRLYEPAIEEVFDGRKRRIMSREKAEREKLLHKYKKEMKGAIREIRRDRDFLAKVKVKETLRNDMQRMEKVKEIFGTAALQQGELNKLKRKR